MVGVPVFFIFFGVLVLFLLIVLAKATYIVKQAEVVIIERLGKFSKILRSGIHFVVPFMDQPRKVIWTFVKEQSHTKRLYRYSEYIERIDGFKLIIASK